MTATLPEGIDPELAARLAAEEEAARSRAAQAGNDPSGTSMVDGVGSVLEAATDAGSLLEISGAFLKGAGEAVVDGVAEGAGALAEGVVSAIGGVFDGL